MSCRRLSPPIKCNTDPKGNFLWGERATEGIEDVCKKNKTTLCLFNKKTRKNNDILRLRRFLQDELTDEGMGMVGR